MTSEWPKMEYTIKNAYSKAGIFLDATTIDQPVKYVFRKDKYRVVAGNDGDHFEVVPISADKVA